MQSVEWLDGYDEGQRMGYDDLHEHALEDAKAGKSEEWIAGFEVGYRGGQWILKGREKNE